MQVSVTLTFDSAAEAAAYLAGNAAPATATKAKTAAAPTAAPTPSPAPSPATAEAAPAAAPETKALDFDKDVVPALKAFAGKDKAAFGGLMKKFGLTKVTDLQAKTDIWADVVAACA